MAEIKDPENTVIIELKDGPVDVTIVFPGAIATDIAGNSGVTVNAPADDTAAAEASSHPTTSAVDAAEATIGAIESGRSLKAVVRLSG